jgi:G protein beta subunit-like protein
LIYDTNASSNIQPLLNIDSGSKNTVGIGFHEKGHWMYTAGSEDKALKIWDFRSRLINCNHMCNAPNQINCAVLHPNQV